MARTGHALRPSNPDMGLLGAVSAWREGGVPERLKGYVGWYLRVYVRVRLLRRGSSNFELVAEGGGGGAGVNLEQASSSAIPV